MILTEEKGSYVMGQVVRLYGSFLINGTSNPDNYRDGKSTIISSVTRVSAGLFEVTLASGFPIPERYITEDVKIAHASPPVKVCQANYVQGSYSQSTRKFRVETIKVGTVGGAAAAPVVDDPDDNTRVSFEFVGCISSVGVDPADV